MNIAFVPIDNRPVCYTLPEQICAADESINLFMPEREWLGDLTKYADTDKIFEWLKDLPSADAVILPLDTVAYGGLISSRRCDNTFEQIKNKIEQLKDILREKQAQIYAFSSIMRISNNNINEEEKEYWSDWGKKIFEYSYQTHKNGCPPNCDIPDDILADYLTTRKRNFEMNKIYLNWGSFFDTLVFSKDDCAEYGFNVKEARELEKLGGFVKTGADEIPLTLLARSIKGELKVAPVFLESEYKNLISNYEDVSIEKSVKGQLELAGCRICEPDEADILLYVNNFKGHQGEIVMKVQTEPFDGLWVKPDKPYMIADVRYANGADNAFVEKLFETDFADDNFYGYCAWNTSANSLGSLICAAKVKYFAKDYNDMAFKKLQVIRFLDDWAYQANVRQQLQSPDEYEIKKKMKPFEDRIFEKFGVKYNINYKFPWHRLFEVEVCI